MFSLGGVAVDDAVAAVLVVGGVQLTVLEESARIPAGHRSGGSRRWFSLAGGLGSYLRAPAPRDATGTAAHAVNEDTSNLTPETHTSQLEPGVFPWWRPHSGG